MAEGRFKKAQAFCQLHNISQQARRNSQNLSELVRADLVNLHAWAYPALYFWKCCRDIKGCRCILTSKGGAQKKRLSSLLEGFLFKFHLPLTTATAAPPRITPRLRREYGRWYMTQLPARMMVQPSTGRFWVLFSQYFSACLFLPLLSLFHHGDPSTSCTYAYESLSWLRTATGADACEHVKFDLGTIRFSSIAAFNLYWLTLV